MGCLGLDDAHKRCAHEKGIVGKTAPPIRQKCGPFSYGHMVSRAWTYTLGVTEIFGVCLPADLSQLFVDTQTGFGFRNLAQRGCLFSTGAADLFADGGC